MSRFSVVSRSFEVGRFPEKSRFFPFPRPWREREMRCVILSNSEMRHRRCARGRFPGGIRRRFCPAGFHDATRAVPSAIELCAKPDDAHSARTRGRDAGKAATRSRAISVVLEPWAAVTLAGSWRSTVGRLPHASVSRRLPFPITVETPRMVGSVRDAVTAGGRRLGQRLAETSGRTAGFSPATTAPRAPRGGRAASWRGRAAWP